MLKKLIPSNDKLLHEKIVKCSYNLDRGKLSYTLTENMFHHNGVGLSANQIGIRERAFVMISDMESQDTLEQRLAGISAAKAKLEEQLERDNAKETDTIE